MAHITIPGNRHPWANPLAVALKAGAGQEAVQQPGLNTASINSQFSFVRPGSGIASGKPDPRAIRGYDPNTYRSMKSIDQIRTQTPPLPSNKYLPPQVTQYTALAPNFGAAQAQFILDQRCNFIFFNWWSAVGTVVPQVLCRLGDIQLPQIIFTPGMELRGFDCQRVYVQWAMTAGETGQIIFAYRNPDLYNLEGN